MVQAAYGQTDVYLVAAPDADVAGTVQPPIHDADGDFARNYDVSTRPCSSFVPTATSVSPRSAAFDTDALVRHLKGDVPLKATLRRRER